LSSPFCPHISSSLWDPAALSIRNFSLAVQKGDVEGQDEKENHSLFLIGDLSAETDLNQRRYVGEGGIYVKLS
jgi:hypothetical protein